ncbi:hypothetical protein [Blastopirellula marina]|uniref:Uncharacterized protein n=1 Tax=Blastopirellula marina TaxID=124 RepID=A0A2S8FAS7_9BACT|nr:hypothetical protein [Blastopirellula marina]PQO29034.1 hypothetical protein C5Y98_22780 [Blastopirellula marina]PTL42306.1 hypothetical protein C5Y97_22790 [Blastopirellula marina]
MATIAPELRHVKTYQLASFLVGQRGAIVDAPQNRYRGADVFRVIQRKSNLLGRSLLLRLRKYEWNLAYLANYAELS